MQTLIQHSITQLIVLVFIFLKGSVISLPRIEIGNKTKSVMHLMQTEFLVRSFQEMPKMHLNV